MIRFDAGTRKIVCPIGDTGIFVVTLMDAGGEALTEEIAGVAIFAVATKNYQNILLRLGQ